MASYWIDTLVLKNEGNTYATLLHHPFLFKGKPTQCSRGSTNNFNNNAYIGNFNPRPFPSNPSNNYGNSYGNPSYNNRNTSVRESWIRGSSDSRTISFGRTVGL